MKNDGKANTETGVKLRRLGLCLAHVHQLGMVEQLRLSIRRDAASLDNKHRDCSRDW